MNSFLFDEWVKELDKKFEKENRKVILIVDNRHFPKLNYVKFYFCENEAGLDK